MRATSISFSSGGQCPRGRGRDAVGSAFPRARRPRATGSSPALATCSSSRGRDVADAPSTAYRHRRPACRAPRRRRALQQQRRAVACAQPRAAARREREASAGRRRHILFNRNRWGCSGLGAGAERADDDAGWPRHRSATACNDDGRNGSRRRADRDMVLPRFAMPVVLAASMRFVLPALDQGLEQRPSGRRSAGQGCISSRSLARGRPLEQPFQRDGRGTAGRVAADRLAQLRSSGFWAQGWSTVWVG